MTRPGTYVPRATVDAGQLERLRASDKRWRSTAENKRKQKDYRLRCLYGITLHELERMVAERGGRCDICGRVKKLHVDHDHDTGRVRGLLCFGCNTSIGKLQDNPAGIAAALAYLSR